MAQPEVLTAEDLALLDLQVPSSFSGLAPSLVLEAFPLTEAILSEGQPVSLLPGQENLVSIDQIRARHHRIAQLLASGMKPVTVSRLVGFSPAYVCNLQRSPAFMELLAHYAAEVEDQFQDFITAASELSQEVLDELRDRLQDNPKQFTVNQLLETLRTTADRSGNAPVARSVSLNATIDMGSKLAAARQRGMALLFPSEEPPNGQ